MDKDSNPYFIKQVENNISEKYRCNWISDDYGNVIRIKYNHSEEITIPKELFSEPSGKITFTIWGQDIREPENECRYLASAHLYYEVHKDKVILSAFR